MLGIHRHDWIHAFLPRMTVFFTIQLCYDNTSDRLLPTGKYQSAISTTSTSPGENPDTPWGDRETSCGLPTGMIVTLHGRPWQFSAIKLIQSNCSRGGDVPRPGPPAATSRELPSQPSSCQPPAVDANLHLPANNKQQPIWSVIAKTRAATFWTKLSSAVRKSPKLSLHQNHFQVSVFNSGC